MRISATTSISTIFLRWRLRKAIEQGDGLRNKAILYRG